MMLIFQREVFRLRLRNKMGNIRITEQTKEMLDRLRMTPSRVYTYDEILKLLIAHKLYKEVAENKTNGK